MANIVWNFKLGAVQNYVNLADLEKCCKMSIHLRRSVLIRPRIGFRKIQTYPPSLHHSIHFCLYVHTIVSYQTYCCRVLRGRRMKTRWTSDCHLENSRRRIGKRRSWHIGTPECHGSTLVTDRFITFRRCVTWPINFAAISKMDAVMEGRGVCLYLSEAYSRPYQNRSSQVNTHLAAFFEICKIDIVLHRSKLKISDNICHNFATCCIFFANFVGFYLMLVKFSYYQDFAIFD
jgi:hypothetical protein